jgi:hypothetical protein
MTHLKIAGTWCQFSLDFSKAREAKYQEAFVCSGLNLIFVRSQLVSVQDCNSDCLPITICVPQGYIISPLLFLVYINDMYKSTDVMECVHYADDTTMFFSMQQSKWFISIC